MIKYLEKTGEINFDKIFNQRLGYLLFKDFCLNVVQEQVQAQFSLQIPFSGEEKIAKIVNGKPCLSNKSKGLLFTFQTRKLHSICNTSFTVEKTNI